MLFASYRLRRAAKQYARRLPKELARRYGTSERYTSDQIRRTVEHIGLDARFLVLGYAAFLGLPEFSVAAVHLDVNPGFEKARALFDRFRLKHWNSADSKDVAYGGEGPGPSDI
jgi:hypothetical protein